MFVEIWLARNKARFDGYATNWNIFTKNIVSLISLIGKCYNINEATSSAYFPMLKKLNININPLFKANSDGVAKGIPFICACGVMFRNANGNHVGYLSFFIGGGIALLAEFFAIIMAMEATINKNWDNNWIDSHSLIVVRGIQNPNLVPWPIKNCWMNCIHKLRNHGFMLTHIYREGNSCVDALASLGLKNRQKNVV